MFISVQVMLMLLSTVRVDIKSSEPIVNVIPINVVLHTQKNEDHSFLVD